MQMLTTAFTPLLAPRRAALQALVALALCAACGLPRGVHELPAPVAATQPVPPLQSDRQRAWQELEYYAFVHFNMNTFTGREWGEGRETPDQFQPSALDCRQWARVAREAGMRGIILTAKHHDGFCLWPTKTSTHSVAHSSWRAGQGDVLRELSDACRAEGLRMGVYLSPWDRNHPSYGDSEAYNAVFREQLREVLSNYGEIFEVWFDGACGEGPNGKRQVYDWPSFVAVVRELQPKAVIFSDAGPDVRWVGNEAGVAGETNWSMLRRDEFAPGVADTDALNQGQLDGTHWLPAECDVSIRPSWYWNADEEGQTKTLAELELLWRTSVGRNANLLLNLPVDRRGLVPAEIATRLLELRVLLDATYTQDLAAAAQATSDVCASADQSAALLFDGDPQTIFAAPEGLQRAQLEIELERPAVFDRVLLAEPLDFGQRIGAFRLEALGLVPGRQGDEATGWHELARGTTIGSRRILTFPGLEAQRLRLVLESPRGAPMLQRFELYAAPAQVALRTQGTLEGAGGELLFLERAEVELLASRPDARVHYTLDGSEPSSASPRAAGVLVLRSSADLRARALAGEQGSFLECRRRFTLVERSALRPALQFVRAPDPGLALEVHSGDWQSLAELAHSTPLARATVAAIDLSKAPQAEHFGLCFEGFVQIERDGLWRFALASDDGSRLYVDGELLLDLDGLHGLEPRHAVLPLAAGWHRLRLEYFQGGGASALELELDGPGRASGPLRALQLAH